MQLSWCMLLIGNMARDTILTGTSLFLHWLLSFWQLCHATVTHIYSEISYIKSDVPRNLQKIPLLEMNPEVHQKFPQNSNLAPVRYSPMRVEVSQSLSPTLYKQRLESEILNWQDRREGRCEWTTSSSHPSAPRRNKENPRTFDGECTVLIYASVNSVSRDFRKNCGDLSSNPLSSESCVNTLVLSRGVKCKQMWRSGYCTVWNKKVE